MAWPRQLEMSCFVLTHAVDLISTRKTPVRALNALLAEDQGGLPDGHGEALFSSGS